MIQRFGWLSVVFGLIVCVSATMAEEKKEAGDKPEKESKFSCKCPVSGKDAVKEESAKYKEKDVYFCCGNCKAAFEKDNANFTTKANHQLVQTKQFTQEKCPLSGGKLNKEEFTKVDGVKVAFCCEKCKGAIDGSTPEEQLTKIFADEVFARTFTAKKVKKEKKEKAEVNGEKAE